MVATTPSNPRLILGYVFSEDPDDLAPLTIDFNSDGTGDVFLKGGGPMIDFFVTEGNRALIVSSPPPNIGGLLGNFSYGTIIGSDSNQIGGLAWYGGFPASGVAEGYGLPLNLNAVAFSALSSNGYTGFFVNASGYFGVEFQIEGNAHYGWVHVSNETMMGQGGYIDAWAYETEPGVPIMAGAIPEPCATFLATLGTACLLLRRRRLGVLTTLRMPIPRGHKSGVPIPECP